VPLRSARRRCRSIPRATTCLAGGSCASSRPVHGKNRLLAPTLAHTHLQRSSIPRIECHLGKRIFQLVHLLQRSSTHILVPRSRQKQGLADREQGLPGPVHFRGRAPLEYRSPYSGCSPADGQRTSATTPAILGRGSRPPPPLLLHRSPEPAPSPCRRCRSRPISPTCLPGGSSAWHPAGPVTGGSL